ncbi:MAG: hypothetical protein JWP32_2870 [Schumannella sp.]|nr:hypothetical protein [Schumannella sp.]
MGMSRQRALPPDIFTDEDLMLLAPEVRLTGIGLRLHADDEGRESTTWWMLKASIWPGHPEITEDVLVDHLLLLDAAGYIGIYQAAGRTYYAVREWPSVSHREPSKHPAPPADLFRNRSGTSPEDFPAWEREGGRGREGAAERPAGMPPSPFCRVHQPLGTEADCRHCGTARLAHDQWLREHREDSTSDEGRKREDGD